MTIRFARRCRRCAVRLACASALAGTISSLLPATGLTAAAPAFAQPAHPYASQVAEAAERFGIPEAWIWAVMRVESNGDPVATSHAGAMGLMQIMPGTWASLTGHYGLGDNPWDTHANISAGAAYLREMFDRYRDLPVALAAYNAGPGRVDDWRSRARPLPAETISYVAKLRPMLGDTAGIERVVQPSLSAPSWRDAALFVARDNDAPGDNDPDSDRAHGVQPGDRAFARSASPRSTISPSSHGLFIALSARSEK